MMASSWGERAGEGGVCVCVFGVWCLGGGGLRVVVWGGVEARHVLTNRLVQHPDGVLLVRGDDGDGRRAEEHKGFIFIIHVNLKTTAIISVGH